MLSIIKGNYQDDGQKEGEGIKYPIFVMDIRDAPTRSGICSFTTTFWLLNACPFQACKFG